MKLLGKYSISSKLKAVINLAYGIAILMCILAFIGTFITMTGILPLVIQEYDIPFHFYLDSEQFDKDLDVTLLRPEAEHIELIVSGALKFLTGDRIFLMLFFLRQWGLLIVYLIVIFQLRKFFNLLSTGSIFVKENSKCIQAIGITIIAGALYNILTKFVLVLYFNNSVLIPDFSVSINWWSVSLSDILYAIFLGFVILIIAEVFRRGAIIEEEQKLTI